MADIPEGGRYERDGFAALFYQNILTTSLTARGYEASKDKEGKPRLEISGSALGQRVKGNSAKVADAILLAVKRDWGVRRVLKTLARLTHEGFPEETRQYRQHDTDAPYGLAPERIRGAMTAFHERLARDLGNGKDPVTIAAWVEYQLDQVIHPFGDGCGRISKAMSAWVLTRAGTPLPLYGSRESYLKALKEGFEGFLAYYRCCAAGGRAADGKERATGDG